MTNVIQTSGAGSLVVQFATMLIDTIVLAVQTNPINSDIKVLLTIENVVNYVESAFYVWMLYNFKNIKNITKNRYYDWAITTPTMLFTYIMYLLMTKKREDKESTALLGLIQSEKYTLIVVFLLNWAMLLCGYLSETGKLKTKLATFLGFMPFIAMFYIIYTKYVTLNGSYITFIYFVAVWALYGIAALLNYKLKNTFYNVLDIFSKNFFGLFLAFMVVFRK